MPTQQPPITLTDHRLDLIRRLANEVLVRQELRSLDALHDLAERIRIEVEEVWMALDA